MIDGALYTRLSGDSAITTIVGTRIYHVLLPQGVTLPAISMQRVSTGGRELTHNGTNQAAEPIFQVSCWATSPKAARELANAVIDRLHGWSGTVGSDKIYRSAVINDNDLFDTEVGIFHVAIDVEILHREA